MLRDEVDRVNSALRSAHDTIRQLRVDKAGLTTRLADEKAKAKAAIDAVKTELERAVRIGHDLLLSTPKKGRRPSDEADRDAMPAVVVRPGGLLAADLARRSSSDGKSKKRRRYDSGLGFLDEEDMEADMEADT